MPFLCKRRAKFGRLTAQGGYTFAYTGYISYLILCKTKKNVCHYDAGLYREKLYLYRRYTHPAGRGCRGAINTGGAKQDSGLPPDCVGIYRARRARMSRGRGLGICGTCVISIWHLQGIKAVISSRKSRKIDTRKWV